MRSEGLMKGTGPEILYVRSTSAFSRLSRTMVRLAWTPPLAARIPRRTWNTVSCSTVRKVTE